MRDLIVARGGASMVKAAYSSGMPAYGVGVGNSVHVVSVHVVDETADLDDAAQMIANAKTFDYATSCLADSSVAGHSSICEGLKQKLVEFGDYICTPAEKYRLQIVMWPKGEHMDQGRGALYTQTRHELCSLRLHDGCLVKIREKYGHQAMQVPRRHDSTL
jgi:hypothetical protein